MEYLLTQHPALQNPPISIAINMTTDSDSSYGAIVVVSQRRIWAVTKATIPTGNDQASSACAA